MGAAGSRESVEKTLQHFAPEEREHLEKLFQQLAEGHHSSRSIDEQAFSEFCTLLPQEMRVTLYRAIMRSSLAKKHSHPHEHLHKTDFFSAVKAITKGTVDEKAQFCFAWCGGGEEKVSPQQLRDFISVIGSKAIGLHPLKPSEKNCYVISESFIDYILMRPFQQKPTYLPDGSGELNSKTVLEPMDFYTFQEWFQKNILFNTLLELVFTRMFIRARDVYRSSSTPDLLGLEENRRVKREKGLNPPILDDITDLLSSEDVWLLSMHVPAECRHNWKLLFSTSFHGTSWTKFSMSILEKGATLLVIEDEGGAIFGAFAFEGLKRVSNFYGSPKNFLFSLSPKKGIYTPSGFNQNYQYINSNTKTLPNGLGYGGQFGYFGLWINEDFETGHSKAKPLSTTYNSPCLSSTEEFKIKNIEVWCLLEPEIDPNREDPQKSVLDAFKEDQVILEMAGRPRHAKDLLESSKSELDDEGNPINPKSPTESRSFPSPTRSSQSEPLIGPMAHSTSHPFPARTGSPRHSFGVSPDPSSNFS